MALPEVQYTLVWGVEFMSHLLVMTSRVMFSPVVSKIGFARALEEAKLVLVDTAVTEPVEVHVHGIGSFGLDTTVDDAFSSAVVCLDRSRGLMMTQFL